MVDTEDGDDGGVADNGEDRADNDGGPCLSRWELIRDWWYTF